MVFDRRIGIVVIGRNEGQRLQGCLDAISTAFAPPIYVDSGSTDESLAIVRNHGIECVELEPPFSAAKARNTGMATLLTSYPEIEFVQFIDGDCELAPGWLEAGYAALAENSDLAVVCGALQERFPEASIYNRLCALEWDRPPGEIEACGGIAMMRVSAFQKADGFREDLVAGEEPELCLRYRQAGWKIRRLADEMATHDAAMTHFSQWWKRALRSGYALAASAALHGRGPNRFRIRESRSNWYWGLVLPASILIALPWTGYWALALLSAYPAMYLRITARMRRAGLQPADAALYARFCVLGKLPEALGQCVYAYNGVRRRRTPVFDYKQAAGQK